MGKGRQYTAEFKEQAVKLAVELGSAKRAAEQLGIPEANIHNWRVKLKNNSLKSTSTAVSVGSKSVEQSDEELKRLRKENEELKKVNYILKKAAAFFSQDHLK